MQIRTARLARQWRPTIQLIGFKPTEETMIQAALDALNQAGYDASMISEVLRVEMPFGYRGMTLGGGVVLDPAAFSSQDMLNHVMEEELLHLLQKARGDADSFAPGVSRRLEEKVDDQRYFRSPE